MQQQKRRHGLSWKRFICPLAFQRFRPFRVHEAVWQGRAEANMNMVQMVRVRFVWALCPLFMLPSYGMESTVHLMGLALHLVLGKAKTSQSLKK